MITKEIRSRTIRDAAREILRDYVNNALNRPYYEPGQNIYFDGWGGLGASAVLSDVLVSARWPPILGPGLNFNIIINLNCSIWESRRSMQRKIAEELRLDRSTMYLFRKQDEDDDFNGVDKSSRAEIPEVGNIIYNMTKGRKLLVVFQNGSDYEVDLARSGLPILDSGHTLLWTFRGRFRLDPAIKEKVKTAHIYLSSPCYTGDLTDSQVLKLVHEEASQFRNGIRPALITDCWFYLCLLYFDHGNAIDYDEDAHASNYWVCDGIIPGRDSASWKTSQRISEAIRLEYLPSKQENRKLFGWSPLKLLEEKKSVWISVTSKNVKNQDIQTVHEEATSYFLTLEKSHHLSALPKQLFHQARKLRVLRLSCCTFSFASPPFICCGNLKFLLMDSCRDEDVEFTSDTNKKQVIEWEFLRSLWVLDILDTNWDWILSPSRMVLMTELRELNLKVAGAITCVWDMAKLELTWLCNLHRLRVIDSPTFLIALAQDSFMGMQKLELLDLSGNSNMEVLPNISATSRLKVLIIDGCAGLQQIEPCTLPKSLESFSFDGFGRASRWKNSLDMPQKQLRPTVEANEEPPKVSKISLEACEHLKNIFLRGLPNLKELNLSDTAIKELDLEAMQVLQIECLFLLGCRNLHRLNWSDTGHPCLKLLCIDSRGKKERGPVDDCWQYYSCSHVQHEASQPLVHIVITDAKFLRAFKSGGLSNIFGITESNQNFHIHLASSVGRRKIIGNNKEIVNIPSTIGYPYMDVLNKVIEKDNSEACIHPLPLGRHIEIAKGACNWEGKEQIKRMEQLMSTVESFHVHDHPSVTAGNLGSQIYSTQFPNIRQCCIHRCPKLHTVFLLDNNWIATGSFKTMETLCASHLPAVQCIWSKLKFFIDEPRKPFRAFQNLRHIHLHSCPRLKSVLPWPYHTLASLETIHITYCGELREIIPWGGSYWAASCIECPKLKHIHLHELPMLHSICFLGMLAPELETIILRGCWSLMHLPAIRYGRAIEKPLAVVDCEKDWWDRLEWDGLEATRRRFIPRHPHYYKKAMPRVSVLR